MPSYSSDGCTPTEPGDGLPSGATQTFCSGVGLPPGVTVAKVGYSTEGVAGADAPAKLFWTVADSGAPAPTATPESTPTASPAASTAATGHLGDTLTISGPTVDTVHVTLVNVFDPATGVDTDTAPPDGTRWVGFELTVAVDDGSASDEFERGRCHRLGRADLRAQHLVPPQRRWLAARGEQRTPRDSRAPSAPGWDCRRTSPSLRSATAKPVSTSARAGSGVLGGPVTERVEEWQPREGDERGTASENSRPLCRSQPSVGGDAARRRRRGSARVGRDRAGGGVIGDLDRAEGGERFRRCRSGPSRRRGIRGDWRMSSRTASIRVHPSSDRSGSR